MSGTEQPTTIGRGRFRFVRYRYHHNHVVHRAFAGDRWIQMMCGINGDTNIDFEGTDDPVTCRRCKR